LFAKNNARENNIPQPTVLTRKPSRSLAIVVLSRVEF
jgi:hypothetical protein